MADLLDYFGGAPFDATAVQVDPPEQQLRAAMLSHGFTPPDILYLDGELHRWDCGSKPGSREKTGWYVAYSDQVPAGIFGDWRDDLKISWRADIGRDVTTAEEMALARRMQEAKEKRESQREAKYETTAKTCESIWNSCIEASADHPYLKRKGIDSHGARVTSDGRLVVPLYHSDGRLASVQYIAADGTKRYAEGGQTSGKFWVLGEPNGGTIYVAEGFATAATIREYTGDTVVVAYSASNLVSVTGELRTLYGAAQQIVIVADNDASGVGQKYADQASAKYGARVVIPPETGDANDYQQAGNDLINLLSPQSVDWLIPADEFCREPAPLSWLVRRWIQENALIMVHGPSGGGKTFVVLDWCLRIASGGDEWAGYRVKPGNVIYLAGEGHHGLRGRIAAWKQYHRKESLTMWLSSGGCDFNTFAGYQQVADSLRQLNEPPALVVVDTLHRFLAGDENSSQDARSMLDACNRLMEEFRCSVLLVHHTGVSDEAQHRARGSSAWRGALDIEISVVPSKDDRPMEIVQRKAKDAELAETVYAKLESVQIDGWIDEDGRAVESAVVVVEDRPKEEKKGTLFDEAKLLVSRAWDHGGQEVHDEKPFVSRSAVIDFMVQSLGLEESTAKKKLKPTSVKEFIPCLLNAGFISWSKSLAGYLIEDTEHGSALLIRKEPC